MTIKTTETITFDDGPPVEVYEMEYQQDEITYWSALAARPDPGWRYIDEQGHKHRWKQDGDEWRVTKSTSRTEHVPCDGSCGNWDCDGYNITVYECSKCGERLKPNWLPDTALKYLPGPETVTASIRGRERDMPKRQLRPLRFVLTRNGEETMRGTCIVVELRTKSGRPAEAKVELRPAQEPD